MNKQPTGFFTNRGDMIYEGDLLRVVGKLYIWDKGFRPPGPHTSEKIIDYIVGAATWLEREHLYALKIPFTNAATPFREDLKFLSLPYWNSAYESFGDYRIMARFVEVFGHVTDHDAREKFEGELSFCQETNERVRQDYKQNYPWLKTKYPDTGNRGFWSKLWEKFS